MIPALIVVRVGSSRLPNKCLLPFGDGNVLEHIIKRARHFSLEPIIATTVSPQDDVIIKVAERQGCRSYRGSVDNIPERLRSACRVFNITEFKRIDADDVFFDIAEFKRIDADDAFFDPLAHAHRYIGDSSDKAENYRCPNKIRLTLDYIEDYWMLCTVLRCLGHFATGNQIIVLFQRNPDLHKINWFRNEEWVENQRCELSAQDTLALPSRT